MNIHLENFIKKKFKKPGKVLDLGAGKFNDVNDFKKLGWFIIGVDKATGVDLNKPFQYEEKFDLVYSNYVIQFIDNKEIFINTCYNNLKIGGWLFLQTFAQGDKIMKYKTLNEEQLNSLLKDKFKKIKIKKYNEFDNCPGHKHWHQILQAVAQKK